MCGIFGYNFSNKQLLPSLLDKLSHRGPDANGSYLDDKFTLGHTRLSIIDTSISANQPMISKDGKSKINLLVVGSFSKRKGYDTILNILQSDKIREKYHFLFAGRDYEGYKKKLEVFQNINSLGQLNKKNLVWYYKNVDLLLHSGYIEGFPKVITEAHICGCPIVARAIVNVDRLADLTFKNDKQLLDILLEKKFSRKVKSELPDEFKYNIIKKKYLDLLNQLQD